MQWFVGLTKRTSTGFAPYTQRFYWESLGFSSE